MCLVGIALISFLNSSARTLPRRTLSERSINNGLIASEMEQPGFLEMRSNIEMSISSEALIIIFSPVDKELTDIGRHYYTAVTTATASTAQTA